MNSRKKHYYGIRNNYEEFGAAGYEFPASQEREMKAAYRMTDRMERYIVRIYRRAQGDWAAIAGMVEVVEEGARAL